MQHGGGRVLVTGGAGFIGSHVAGAYLRAGYEVVVLDSLVHGRREQVPEGAEFVHADIRSAEAARLIRSRGFDVISHHAAQVSVSRSVADPRFDASVNVDGLLNLLGAAAEAGVRRIQYVSSAAVYGPAGGAATRETAPKNPETPYGVSKLAGEQYLYYYHRVHGVDYVAMRYANVYGPRQDPHGEAGVVAIYSARLQSGEPVTVFGDGEQTRDFCYIDNTVAANLLAAESKNKLKGEVVNIACGERISLNQL
ncbi:MAG TPA: NAD-dependent epimerase/dehydratase family protein, partial [Longimicrobium sp.]